VRAVLSRETSMPAFQIIARLLHLWPCEVCGDVTQVGQKERYDFVQSTDDTAHSGGGGLLQYTSILDLALLILILYNR
jgi:hypothetical protein